MKKIQWYKLSEQQPEDSETEQVIVKLGDSYIFLTGQQINKNIIREAAWSDEEIKEQANMIKFAGFFGEVLGIGSEKTNSDAEEDLKVKIQQKKLAIKKAEWCKFSDVLKKILET